MKKIIRFSLFIILSFIIILTVFAGYCFAVTFNVKIDKNKLLNNADKNIIFYDINGKEFSLSENKKYVEFNEINTDTINAFISIEDKRFYSHNGIDKKGILRAIFNNIKSFSYKEGASTITQQLVKNTQLTSEKTLKRKMFELKLARQIEKKYSKNEILEMYLNNIYFGDNCFGIYSASKHYFNKEPKELNLNESAMLAGLIKSPLNYSPTKNYDNSIKRKNIVLKKMLQEKYIDKNTYDYNIKKEIQIENNGKKTNLNYSIFLNKELDEIIDIKKIYNKNIKIYTSIDLDLQKILEKNTFIFNNLSDSATSIIMNNKGEIIAYSSNLGDTKRQLGSIIKPICVYAPAFDENIINEFTVFSDTKCMIDGKKISNYKNIYYNDIEIKDAISKSSNTVSAKVLNSLGIQKCKEKVKNLPINICDDDDISISIGSTKFGNSLKDISSCYTVFMNDGFYNNPTIIRKITQNKRIIYEKKEKNIKIFDEGTTYLINDCLNNCVKNGTAKKMKQVNENLCSKTGTVGNANGNMDAYSICYDKNFLCSVWMGNEKSELMNNSVTGGTYPTLINKNIFSEIYKIKEMPTQSEWISFSDEDKKDIAVIGADTSVIIDDRILGKPVDKDDARKMLTDLSGRTHSVVTGVSIFSYEGEITFAEESVVEFSALDEYQKNLIERYINTDEPYDKAGGYGIQEGGALLVKSVSGDYFNVVGLPVMRLSRELSSL